MVEKLVDLKAAKKAASKVGLWGSWMAARMVVQLAVLTALRMVAM